MTTTDTENQRHELRRLTAVYRSAEKKLATARTELQDAVRDAEGLVPQAEISRITGWSLAHVKTVRSGARSTPAT